MEGTIISKLYRKNCRIFQEFFEFLLPLLQASVPLLEVFRDNAEVVRLIIELFALTAENYIIFLNQVRGQR